MQQIAETNQEVKKEIFRLFAKTSNFILKNIKTKTELRNAKKILDAFIIQILIFWYLQKKGLLNNDSNYLLTKYQEISKNIKNEDETSYYRFLKMLLSIVSNYANQQYYEDDRFGNIAIIPSALFIDVDALEKIEIPNKCFYKEEQTEIFKNNRRISDSLPLLNLLEIISSSVEETPEWLVGVLYEKFLATAARKNLAAYYTPAAITKHLSETSIESYLLDQVNKKFTAKYCSIDEVIDTAKIDEIAFLLQQLKSLKILDPAVGAGHFLVSLVDVLTNIYLKIWHLLRKKSVENLLKLEIINENSEIEELDLLGIEDKKQFILLTKYFTIIPNNTYGVDLDSMAVKVAKTRVLLSVIKHIGANEKSRIKLSNIWFNIKHGNSLIGYKRKIPLDQIEIGAELQNHLTESLKELRIEQIATDPSNETNKISTIEVSKVEWSEIIRIKLAMRETIIRSLNVETYQKLNKLYQSITRLGNETLDSIFAAEYEINYLKLRQMHTFHWIFEFPEVFIDNGGFDVIIGNPPYGNILTDDAKKLVRAYASCPDEIASVFVENCMLLNKARGYMVFIITYAITFNQKLSSLRNKIYQHYAECWVATFDRDKCRLFTKMTQSTSIMQCKRKVEQAHCKFYSSSMFRTMPEMEKIAYQQANKYLLSKGKIGEFFEKKHRLPKIGSKINQEILKKLITGNSKKMANIMDETGAEVWIRTSGNYWYNAWDKKPYESSEIKSIKVSKLYKDFVILLINSSLFYLWFRIYGDGRHMNKDIMHAFPIPDEKQIVFFKQLLAKLRVILMKSLQSNFDAKHKRFYTSNVKPIIDICDILLGKFYGLTTEEIKHIINYEASIRGGQKIPNEYFEIIDFFAILEYLGMRVDDQILTTLIKELYKKEYCGSKSCLYKHIMQEIEKIENYNYISEKFWENKMLEENEINSIRTTYACIINNQDIQ